MKFVLIALLAISALGTRCFDYNRCGTPSPTGCGGGYIHGQQHGGCGVPSIPSIPSIPCFPPPVCTTQTQCTPPVLPPVVTPGCGGSFIGGGSVIGTPIYGGSMVSGESAIDTLIRNKIEGEAYRKTLGHLNNIGTCGSIGPVGPVGPVGPIGCTTGGWTTEGCAGGYGGQCAGKCRPPSCKCCM